MITFSVRGLRKSYGGVPAVREMDLDLRPGEILALIGPNGAGKSTCFNMMTGQVVPDAGSIRLFGRELIGLKPRQIWRLGVGRTFQITATFASLTVLENLQLALISHHHRIRALLARAGSLYRDEALALLRLVGMEPQADRPCSILAYGDLKRVELALALTNDPKLLLMDEPTAGMAPRERIELMRLVARIVGERNICMLFTEHDMDVVFAHATSIMVLNRGRLVTRGSPGEVRDNAEVQAIYLGSGAVYDADAVKGVA
ncbi:ABC transporter ATP-binding protein [Telmatospirillum siberiense]|uniref:ABC transporter ATP-binding protein n=1 Tax=Telmatospirillum siberiense TaxID=382514 RepID=A0A2N3PQJ0_9PROT|nr:ABC transporter ATP-binding protein [Telmatospirillum siberiense]PKU22654.1 ABC transporter ATP-binding protein [Telmatospirillum siberiense]